VISRTPLRPAAVALAAVWFSVAPPPALAADPSPRPLGGTLQGMAQASPAPPPVFVPGVYPKRAPGTTGAGAPFDAYATVSFALTHEPALLAERATVLNLDAQFTKARAAEYPALAGELQNQIQKQSNSAGSLAQFGVSPTGNFSENTAQLSSTYNLFNGTAQINAQQAKRQVDNAKFELQRQEEQAVIAVSSAFFALAANRENVLVDVGDLRYQQNLLATAQAEERVGRIAGVDVLRAQVAVERSQSTLVQARTDEANAREALAVQIGAPSDTQFAVPDVPPEPAVPTTPLDELGTIAKMNRPEISEARAALAASQLTDASVDSDLRPTVAVNGSFGSQVSPTNFVLEQQQIDASNAAALASYEAEQKLFPGQIIPGPTLIPAVDRHMPGFWQFNIVSTFNIPLYDYGQRAAQHHAARAQIASSLASLYNAYDTVQADVNAAQRNLAAAAEKLSLAKLSERAAAESARISQLQYKNGLISFTDVTQTQQTALATEFDLVSARVAYVTAFIRLRTALAPPNAAAAADLRGL
jgi:multidrug efflux system outer membrane protein